MDFSEPPTKWGQNTYAFRLEAEVTGGHRVILDAVGTPTGQYDVACAEIRAEYD